MVSSPMRAAARASATYGAGFSEASASPANSAPVALGELTDDDDNDNEEDADCDDE